MSVPEETGAFMWEQVKSDRASSSSGMGSSSAPLVPTSCQLVVSSTAAVSTGVVVADRVEFSGHSGQWLNDTQMKMALGHAPGYMERPVLLNALAYKCGDKSCASNQCSVLLDEWNVYELRLAWSAQFGPEGGASQKAKTAVIETLMEHCTTQEVGRTNFTKVEVSITNRRGLQQKVELCVKTWGIVVVGLGRSTFDKMRASIPDQIRTRRAQIALQGTAAPLQLTFTSGSTGTKVKEPSHAQKFGLLQAYVRELVKTLDQI